MPTKGRPPRSAGGGGEGQGLDGPGAALANASRTTGTTAPLQPPAVARNTCGGGRLSRGKTRVKRRREPASSAQLPHSCL